MGIAAKAPRGGLAEELAGLRRVMVLRNAEIERFEDQHGGIFAVWDGFMGRGPKPTTTQVRDLVALGLVGGGMADIRADALVGDLGPDSLPRLYSIAQALIGVAFLPDTGDGADDDDAGDATEDDPGKKTDPAPGE